MRCLGGTPQTCGAWLKRLRPITAKDQPGPRTPALGCAMSRSQYPTTNSIFAAAAKYGLNVRIAYGPDGRVASVESIGKVGESNGIPGNGMNPWDSILEDQKRPS